MAYLPRMDTLSFYVSNNIDSLLLSTIFPLALLSILLELILDLLFPVVTLAIDTLIVSLIYEIS